MVSRVCRPDTPGTRRLRGRGAQCLPKPETPPVSHRRPATLALGFPGATRSPPRLPDRGRQRTRPRGPPGLSRGCSGGCGRGGQCPQGRGLLTFSALGCSWLKVESTDPGGDTGAVATPGEETPARGPICSGTVAAPGWGSRGGAVTVKGTGSLSTCSCQ